MKRFTICRLGLLALALVGPSAWAQEAVLFQSQEGGGQFLLAPAGNQAPLFLEGAPPNQAVGPLAQPVQVAATVNGNAVANFGILPAIFPNLRVDIGFEYLRPEFPNRSVTLVVPSGVNGNFSSLAGSGNVSYDFGFIPKITMGYQFPDVGLGVTASAELTTLSGHLMRTIESAAGQANLTATATLSFAMANLIEGSLSLPLDRFACFQDTCLEDTIILATLGMRYSHLSQDYNASLDSGANNSSTLAAHQDWDGFGLTTSLSFLYPLPRDFFLYGVSRGSFLLGTNNRISTLSVVLSGSGAPSTSTKLTENKTEFVPVGEFEAGVGWGKPLAPRTARTLAGAQTSPLTGPILWVKAGFVADVWGSLGFLSAPNGIQGFSDSSLFLYGVSVMAGINF